MNNVRLEFIISFLRIMLVRIIIRMIRRQVIIVHLRFPQICELSTSNTESHLIVFKQVRL